MLILNQRCSTPFNNFVFCILEQTKKSINMLSSKFMKMFSLSSQSTTLSPGLFQGPQNEVFIFEITITSTYRCISPIIFFSKPQMCQKYLQLRKKGWYTLQYQEGKVPLSESESFRLPLTDGGHGKKEDLCF